MKKLITALIVITGIVFTTCKKDTTPVKATAAARDTTPLLNINPDQNTLASNRQQGPGVEPKMTCKWYKPDPFAGDPGVSQYGKWDEDTKEACTCDSGDPGHIVIIHRLFCDGPASTASSTNLNKWVEQSSKRQCASGAPAK
jgi:hypothetical protein